MRPNFMMHISLAQRICSVGLLLWLCSFGVQAAAASLAGSLPDPQGQFVPEATIRLLRRADSTRRETKTDAQGRFSFNSLDGGEYRLSAESPGFVVLTRTVAVQADGQQIENLQFSSLASQNESVTVTAAVSDVGVFEPDPAQRVMIRDETLDANPGRPGMPVSIPGMPIESPAGGVKPPQYFAPGVAGDHGEPIAMFFQVGGYLFPDNLPANAHGNGYADPNVIIPVAIESVQTDGAAFNLTSTVARQNFIRDEKRRILGSEGLNTISIASTEHGDFWEVGKAGTRQGEPGRENSGPARGRAPRTYISIYKDGRKVGSD